MKLRVIFQNVFAATMMLISLNSLASQTDTATSSKDKYTYTENKLNVIVEPKHPEFIIKVKSNPTTGYSWFLREYDANLIQPVKRSVVAPNQKLAGAPGFEIWTFKIKPAGFVVPQQFIVRLIYARPWQGADNSSQLVFRVTTLAR